MLNRIKCIFKKLKLPEPNPEFKALREEREQKRKDSFYRFRRNPKKELKALLMIHELRGTPEALTSFGVTNAFSVLVLYLIVSIYTITIEDISKHALENNLDNRYCEMLTDDQCLENIKDLTELKNNEERKEIFKRYNDSTELFGRVGDTHNSNVIFDVRVFDYVYFAEKNGYTKEDIDNFKAQIHDEKEMAASTYKNLAFLLNLLFFLPISACILGLSISIANRSMNKEEFIQYKLLSFKNRLALEDQLIQDTYKE